MIFLAVLACIAARLGVHQGPAMCAPQESQFAHHSVCCNVQQVTSRSSRPAPTSRATRCATAEVALLCMEHLALAPCRTPALWQPLQIMFSYIEQQIAMLYRSSTVAAVRARPTTVPAFVW